MRPKCLSLSELGNLEVDHLVDVREPLAFASGHLPESMNLPVGMISAFAGWFFREGERIALVASDEDQLEAAMTHLTRIALDRVVGGYVGVVRSEENTSEVKPLMRLSYVAFGLKTQNS